MDLAVLTKVDKWVKKHKLKKGDCLFTNRTGNRYLDSSSLNKTLSRYCKRIGIM